MLLQNVVAAILLNTLISMSTVGFLQFGASPQIDLC